MSVFFTADTHFFHANIIQFCNRPYVTADEMNEGLIAAWNLVVPPDGVVYHLGDVAFMQATKVAPLLARCNGTKHLIRGNHDKRKMDHLFASAQDYLELTLDLHGKQQRAVLSHYPFRSWNGSGRGAWMLHGHTHNTIENVPGRLDVGVDCNNMMPFTVDEIATRMFRNKGAPPL